MAVFMAVVIMLTVAVPAFAQKGDVTPVIVVGGVGTRPYYQNGGTQDEIRVFPPTPDVAEIVTIAAMGIVKTIVTRDSNCISEMVGKILESVFEKFKCNADGDSKYENVASVYYPLSIDNYEFDFYNEVPEVAIAGTVAQSIGVDPVHFGLIMVCNLAIGFITPPLGINLFVASRIADSPMETIMKGIVPFILVMLGCLMLITYIPQITMFLPNLMK